MQYKCDFCQDTGSLHHDSDLLDCSHCDATAGRIALDKWLSDQYKQGGMARTDSLAAWRIHQRALAMAPKQEAPADGLREVVGKVIKAMESSAAPINLAHALVEVAAQDGRIDFDADLMAELLTAYSAAPAVANGALPELPEPLEIYWPELHSSALGCGVEDRGLRDRYECAEYGWQDGVDKAAACVPDAIYDADQMRAYGQACAAAGPDAALVKALEKVLHVSRGTSGRIILESSDEADIRAALSGAKGN